MPITSELEKSRQALLELKAERICRQRKTLTLRSQPDGLELVKGDKSDLNSLEIQLGLQSKVVELGRGFEHLKFDVSAQGSKEMVGLRSDGLSRRFF